MATKPTLSEREKIDRRLKTQRRKISKTIKLFARQLDKFLGELAELQNRPRRFRRPMGVIEAERKSMFGANETVGEVVNKLEAAKKSGRTST